MKRKGLYLSSMLLLTGVVSLSGCSASTSIYSAAKARSLTSEEKDWINEAFTRDADMSALFPYAIYPIYVDQLDQITTLTVNGKGIEATSVTAAKSNGNLMSAAVEYVDEHIFLEYPVDRAFMYVITSPYDIPVFSGYINNA